MDRTTARVQLGTVTLRGNRRTNQDAVLSYELPDGRILVALSDGMGGYAGGERASQLALETLVGRLEAGDDLERAVAASNAAVHAERNIGESHTDMGATLVAALVEDGRYLVANVGDSRAYRWAGDGLSIVTSDHSFVAEAIRTGQMSAEEAARSPWRNALTRAIGGGEEVEVDVHGPFPVEPGLRLLLCSDGLYKVLPEEAILEGIREGTDPAESARRLAAEALARGSDDNISAAVVVFPGSPAPAPSPQPGVPPRTPDVPGSGNLRSPWWKRRRVRRSPSSWTPLELGVMALAAAGVVCYVVLLVFFL